ncbi:transmembrane protein 234 homolog [Cydia strobilella]|uniref:transmembrane protein 234 homolog n=1 Tax=Cydia strobilella TaxID=1100964 RepID=UPI003006BC85
MLDTIGLLVLTGLLWGCTNPFIKRGTKGLRDVRESTWPAQAWAEVCFLLGNWRYVLPWLVNQLGSLAYLFAVRRAPLSLAVPAANGLAFAATAATGAAAGDRPLDRSTILGIALIVAGTALCCWDQVD